MGLERTKAESFDDMALRPDCSRAVRAREAFATYGFPR